MKSRGGGLIRNRVDFIVETPTLAYRVHRCKTLPRHSFGAMIMRQVLIR